MDSNDRMLSIVWGFISAAFVATVLLISSCCVKESEYEQKVKLACIARGGIWTLDPNKAPVDSNKYYCNK